MNFFQTIWTLLSTPNQKLFIILTIPFNFLEAYISLTLFTTILNITTTKRSKLLYVILFGLLSNIANFLVPVSYVIFVNMIIWPILVFFVLKTTILKSILSEVIFMIFTSSLDFIFAKLFNFFNISSSEIMVIPIYRFSIMLSMYLIIYLIAKLIKYFKLNIGVFDNMHKKTRILLTINLILMILIIAMQFYLVRYYSSTMPALITGISILGLISYFALSIFSIINSSKLELASRDLEGANLTIHSLRILHDTVRTFKHDFDNIVNGIGGYIRNNDIQGLTDYYNQLQADCHKTNNLYSLSPDVINQPAIYNIMATKYYIADESNIQINLDIFLDLNEIEQHMKIYEFVRILGILLDNAIDASKECDEKTINVIFRKEEHKRRIIVIIENTYMNKDVDIDKIFEKGFSTKPQTKNSGLGLWKIRQILKKNNNLNLFTSKTNDLFKQQFEIYY